MFGEAIQHPSGQAGYRVHPADMEVAFADALLGAESIRTTTIRHHTERGSATMA